MTMTQTSRMPEVLDGVGAVKRAAEYVSTKMGLGSPDEALALIDRGDRSVYQHFRYALARESGSILASFDKVVERAFIYPDDECEDFPAEPICLGLLVTQKTPALEALAESLSSAILAAVTKQLKVFEAFKHLLHIELLDSQDISRRAGMAAALGSIYNPPVRVWPQDPEGKLVQA